jgi:RND superfamily putative drug exporter
MDYEVFVIGAIRDARAGHGNDRQAVVDGLASTAGVVTAAALIMALVFGSFVTSNSLDLKVIGVGLAAAIVVDASLIRLLVVPATMTFLGPAAWWRPRCLGRLLQRDGTRAAGLTAPQLATQASVPALTLRRSLSRRSA